jgi:two-component system LytT family response regulator
MKIRAAIVDDEPLARERLRTLLRAEGDVSVVAECAEGRAAVRAIETHRPDVVFLDVQMPEMDGFAVLQALSPRRVPNVVFVTAYDKYALQAFDVHAVDYLLKPFDRDRFRRALARVRAAVEAGEPPTPRLLALLERLRREGRLDRLVVKSRGRIVFLRADEIDWIEAAGNYVRVHAGKEAHLMRETLGTLEERLDHGRFVRIHRSTIVNLDSVKELVPSFHGDYVVRLRDGTELVLSRSFRGRVPHLLGRGL